MAIHPIEYRYGSPEMKKVWSEEEKLRKILQVEAALAQAEAEVGLIPEEAARMIASSIDKVGIKRVREIEDEIKHDVMAIVLALAEECGEAGKWIHFGATSSDILDTSTALQFKETLKILREQLTRLREILVDKAEENKHTVCAGRTHGQIGIPTTYGLRFAIWSSEVDRHLDRLQQLASRLLVGKMSGAVGTMAAFGPKGIEIQRKTLEYLALGEVDVSNQIVQRDRHAEFIMWMANTSTTLDKICVEIRSLQRSEIAEVEEGFGKKQVGSSTMPHKRNPIKSEQVCGLARIIRGLVEPGLLNNTLWDERDLTNSSCERIVFPEACILTDHLIRLTRAIIQNLRFYPENIRRNLELLHGLNMGEAIMIELAKRGVGRLEAHAILRDASMKARETRVNLKEVLLADDRAARYLSRGEIEEIMIPENYIGTSVEQVEALVKKLRSKR